MSICRLFSCSSSSTNAINEFRKKRDQQITEIRSRVEKQDIKIRDEVLAHSFAELRNALQNCTYTATEVLNAYAWKALEVHQRTNCICEVLIESFEEASELDAKFGKNGSNQHEKPPLFGVPFSVKENFFVKGYDTTVGLASLLGNSSERDCTFITLLRSLGAIPFVRTNVPQTLMQWMCSNPVYGTTGNPFNPERVPGGSSGGDAALTSARGTPFGTGSDIGGSLRIPAAFCGIVSLKPTQARFLLRNSHPGVPGHSRMGLGSGVFTHTVAEQILILEHTLGRIDYHSQLSPRTVPLPLKRDKIDVLTESGKHLRIGYFFDDGFLKPTPGCARVVKETVEMLREAGHEMVAFKVNDPFRAVSLVFRAIVLLEHARKLLSENPVDKYMRTTSLLLKIPTWLRWIFSCMINPFSPELATVLAAYVNSAEDVRTNNAEVDRYTDQFINYWLHDLGDIDAVVCPAFPIPPPQHHFPDLIGAACFATAFWNMLDFPAGIVPTGVVTEEDDNALNDELIWPTGYNIFLKQIRDAARNSKGLPLAVQVAALPFEEEKCLAVMREIERLWQHKKTPKNSQWTTNE